MFNIGFIPCARQTTEVAIRAATPVKQIGSMCQQHDMCSKTYFVQVLGDTTVNKLSVWKFKQCVHVLLERFRDKLPMHIQQHTQSVPMLRMHLSWRARVYVCTVSNNNEQTVGGWMYTLFRSYPVVVRDKVHSRVAYSLEFSVFVWKHRVQGLAICK